MSLETRISSVVKAIGQKIKQLVDDISNKVDKSGNTPNGYLKTNSSGTVVVDSTPLATLTPEDGVEYVMKDGVWIQLVKTSSLDWNTGILNKPNEFTPEAHTHDDRYYTESELDTLLDTKSDTTHTHDDIYYTETEIDTLLNTKEDAFTKNTAFNKSFGTESGTVSEGNHNHNTLYFTKTEVNTLLSNLGNSGHDHNDVYYTKVQVDTLLQDNLGSTHNHDDRYYTETEIDTLLDDKADSIHNHDDRYYTETEIDTLLDTKALSSHNHDDRYYTETEISDFLSNKSDVNHNHDERYFTEEEVTNKLNTLRSDLESVILDGSDFTPEGGIEVSLDGGRTLGKYGDGDIIPGNLSVLQVLKEAVSEYYPAVFFSPEGELTSDPLITVVREVGESINIELTSTYTQKDGGAVTTYEIFKDGSQILNSPSDNSVTDSSVELTYAGITYTSTISYSAGTTPKPNSLGVDEANTIASGTIITNELIFKGYMPIFKGSVASAYTTGTDVRANLTKELKTENISEFILDTGNTNKIFQFWVPDTYTVDSIIDMDAFNMNIIRDYVESNLQVPDASGTLIAGKLYTLTMDVPYSNSHKHKIILS